jgi:hypothetical protein
MFIEPYVGKPPLKKFIIAKAAHEAESAKST